MKDVAGAGDGRLPNVSLGDGNAGCASVVDFWALVLGASRGASTSARDGVAFVERVGGTKVSSGG